MSGGLNVSAIAEGNGVNVWREDRRAREREDHLFLRDGDQVRSVAGEIPEHVKEELESEGYHVGPPVRNSDLCLVGDAPDCSECGTLMMEQDSVHAGGTPTSPTFQVLFRCPDCGYGKKAFRRR